MDSSNSEGWTIHFIERSSRYWVSAMAGHKDELLFQRGTQQAWQWAQTCPYIRWFTDGERRYAKALWDLASVYLALRNCPSYRTRKGWREGLEPTFRKLTIIFPCAWPEAMAESLSARGF